MQVLSLDPSTVRHGGLDTSLQCSAVLNQLPATVDTLKNPTIFARVVGSAAYDLTGDTSSVGGSVITAGTFAVDTSNALDSRTVSSSSLVFERIFFFDSADARGRAMLWAPWLLIAVTVGDAIDLAGYRSFDTLIVMVLGEVDRDKTHEGNEQGEEQLHLDGVALLRVLRY